MQIVGDGSQRPGGKFLRGPGRARARVEFSLDHGDARYFVHYHDCTAHLAGRRFIPRVEVWIVSKSICGGRPVIRGTRIMLRTILGMVAGGYTVERILGAYPDLTADDVNAALEYVARVVDEEQVIAR